MRSETAIHIENLGKKFVIGHQLESDFRGSFARRLRRLLGGSAGGSREEFWALKDVSFEIPKGEAVGIIGRNGAGKSTLLKVLSRITYPTTGRFEINGRVSSLLEVGTGFHQELTGRENIYLNGTILGMRRAEIKKKFDAIVDFSGVEKFLDTPVKHYSSGMKVRLAFSVAAHLEPEILMIDEVLAVGDAEFQKKCLGKMDEVSRNQGRTVLFVSHNMAAISRLCRRVVILEGGSAVFDGDTSAGTAHYLGLDTMTHNAEYIAKFAHPVVRELRVSIPDGDLLLRVQIVNFEEVRAPSVGFVVADNLGNKLFGTNPKFSSSSAELGTIRDGWVNVRVTQPKLRNNMYSVSLWVGDGSTDFFAAEDCLTFMVQNMVDAKLYPEIGSIGPVVPAATWTLSSH